VGGRLARPQPWTLISGVINFQDVGARFVNALLGLWLFLSAFLWPQPFQQRVFSWSIGIMVVTAALLGAAGVKLGRYLNAIFGAWLILSSILRPGLDRVTFWNYLLVGAALVLFALTASLHGLRRRSVADV
jgi:hypothetical protein